MRWILIFAGLTVLAGIAIYRPATEWWEAANKTTYETRAVSRRTIVVKVSSTGEVKPVLSVSVGSFVSGPINALHVDFNDEVSEGELLAEIDPRIYNAAVARDEATLTTRKAEVRRVEAQLQQAVNDEKRSLALQSEGADYISQAEIDQFHFARKSLEAQLEVAEAAVIQAEATLENSEANLNYTKILSPVDGIIIDKKIDLGQTLAAQFQAPELFIIAPDMQRTMHVFASIDEADIGLIQKAQSKGQPVEFTVDAHPDDSFIGRIEQIRFSSTELQNVVTYPVVVSSPNPDLKLLPGMTADLSFTIEEKKNAICVPNIALRYFPPDAKLVRESDRKLITGESDDEADDEEQEDESADAENPRVRHVWVEGTLDESGLRAIAVTTGVSDNRYTEIFSGELEVGQLLVVGKPTTK